MTQDKRTYCPVCHGTSLSYMEWKDYGEYGIPLVTVGYVCEDCSQMIPMLSMYIPERPQPSLRP